MHLHTAGSLICIPAACSIRLTVDPEMMLSCPATQCNGLEASNEEECDQQQQLWTNSFGPATYVHRHATTEKASLQQKHQGLGFKTLIQLARMSWGAAEHYKEQMIETSSRQAGWPLKHRSELSNCCRARPCHAWLWPSFARPQFWAAS